MEPRVLRNTRGFFDGRSKLLVVVLGLAFIAVVTILDYLTGPSLSLSLLYLMPIGLVTWNLGRRWGSATVVVATIAGILADVLAAPGTGQTDPVPYWNAIVRFAVFLAFAMLLDTLRSIIDAQWERVEVEAERSSDLREMNDVKDTLLHAVSHDLKGPLAGIIGAMQTIRRDDDLHLTEEEKESLYQVIEQSGRKMNRLIDDLLDLDRIDRGKLHPQRKPTDVGELARRVVARVDRARRAPDAHRGRPRAGRRRPGQGGARDRQPAGERVAAHAAWDAGARPRDRGARTGSCSWSRTRARAFRTR